MQTTLVTGANRGIGLELCRQLAERGDSIIAVCREPGTELPELGVRVEAGIDVCSAEALASLAHRLDGLPIDTLINNAGVFRTESLDGVDFEEISRVFAVNSIGPLRVTKTLLDNLRSGSKVALITSMMGSMTDNGSGGSYAYRMSKAALNAAGVSLARDLQARGVAVAILHPGYVQTRMTGFQGNLTPEESASGLIARLDELTLETTGTFWHANGDVIPW